MKYIISHLGSLSIYNINKGFIKQINGNNKCKGNVSSTKVFQALYKLMVRSFQEFLSTEMSLNNL